MYLNSYNLRKQPFHITPDPEFLYLSPSHKEALAAIIYGIEEKKGFVAIVGAVGVGKTTILRSYLEKADKKRLKIIYVFNPRLTFEGLLRTIYQELELPVESNDVVEMTNRLYEVLIEELVEGEDLAIGRMYAQAPEVDGLTVVVGRSLKPGQKVLCGIRSVNGLDLEALPVQGAVHG